ncbi:hypothetical protein AKJ09_08139 [Labilithrix luteola]|uniref:Uncharacterized protein n=2 Tax=Labilithrix luteola TaxID=1391654 RepID=A0A0K1Q6L2_9BACT|nr:hypothetical protein AKJ09_08139 [Labilithrix luteola]
MAAACAPAKEPKQAAAPDPTEEGASNESSSSSSGGGSSSSSSSSNGGSDGIIVPPPGGASGGGAAPAKAGAKGEAASVSSLVAMQDGLKWGMSHADVIKVYTQTGGVIWKDYDEKLAKARVGPEMTALEAERETQKAAFGRSFIEFKDTPTGYDATGIKSEYTYKNREALMWVQRQGKKRYFFFINDRLWKMYDEVPLGDSGQLGKTFVEAVNLMNGKLGAAGRIQGADAAKGINTTTVDWKDSGSHLRLVDRSGERIVGVVVEDNGTLNSLASLRTNKSEDPTAIDPTIAAVTKGGLSDPNAAQPAGSAKPETKKAPPKKK